MREPNNRNHLALFVLALPIFPVRLQTSIFGAGELNFRVRNGNGWTLTAINTNFSFQRAAFAPSKPNKVTAVLQTSACILLSLEPLKVKPSAY